MRKSLQSRVTAISLAAILALGYFALMATLMWMFENAVNLNALSATLDSSGQVNTWAVIAVTALVIFVLAYWGLGKMSSPGPAQAAVTGAENRAATKLDAELQHWSWRDVLVPVSAMIVILGGTGGYILAQQDTMLDAARYRQFSLIGQLKAQSVSRWVQERQRDLAVLLDNAQFKVELARWMRDTSARGAVGDSVRSDMEAVLQANGFDGLAVVDRRGKVSISVPDDLSARKRCLQVATAKTAPTQRPIELLSAAFNDAEGTPKLDVIGTVREANGQSIRKIATLCLRLDLSQRLLPMVSRWPGTSHSGEILLGRPDGDDIMLINGQVDTQAPWGLHRLAGQRRNWEAAAAAAQHRELMNLQGDNGVSKLQVAFAVPETPWLLVARMDSAEADQLQFRKQRYATVIIGFALLFAAGGFAIAWAHSRYGREVVFAQRELLLAQLQELAYYDELTGLPSRRLVLDRLDMAIHEAERRGEQVGVMFIDLNKFKAINDTHGHLGGDFVLKTVADRLQSGIRKNDSAGRLGGDEYLIVVTGNPDASTLQGIRQKLLQAISEPFLWQNITMTVSASIGLAIYPKDGDKSADLIAKADASMYEDKHSAA